MSEPPRVEVTGGSPSPEEEEAVRAAILKIWRDDVAAAARSGGMSRWMLAGRGAATGNGAEDLRRAGETGSAWRLSTRLAGFGLVSARRTGRGDSK